MKKHIILIVSYLFLFLFLNDKMIATIKKKTDEYYILCVCIYIYIYIYIYIKLCQNNNISFISICLLIDVMLKTSGNLKSD